MIVKEDDFAGRPSNKEFRDSAYELDPIQRWCLDPAMHQLMVRFGYRENKVRLRDFRLHLRG